MNKAEFSAAVFELFSEADSFIKKIHKNSLTDSFEATYASFLREEDNEGSFPSYSVALYEGEENEEEILVDLSDNFKIFDILKDEDNLETGLYLYFQQIFTKIADQDVSYPQTKLVLNNMKKDETLIYNSFVTSYFLALIHSKFETLRERLDILVNKFDGQNPFENFSFYDVYFKTERYYVSSRCW